MAIVCGVWLDRHWGRWIVVVQLEWCVLWALHVRGHDRDCGCVHDHGYGYGCGHDVGDWVLLRWQIHPLPSRVASCLHCVVDGNWRRRLVGMREREA